MADNIVEEWLRSLHLTQYTQAFLDNGYDDLEVCKQIGNPDLDAIGVTDPRHRVLVLDAVRNLREQGGTAVYFTLEEKPDVIDSEYSYAEQLYIGEDTPICAGPSEIATGLRTVPKHHLALVLTSKLAEDDINIRHEPYHGTEDSFEHLECLANRYAADLNTHKADVLHTLQELQRTSLSSETNSQSQLECVDPQGFVLCSIYGQSARSVPPPLPVRPPPPHTYVDPLELEAFTKNSPLVSPRHRRNGSISQDMDDLISESDLDVARRGSVLSRFLKSRRSGRKYIYRPHEGDLHASEITMSDDDRIQLMLLVKEGKISMEQAVEAVKQYEIKKRRERERSLSHSSDGPESSGGKTPSSPKTGGKFSPFPFLKIWKKRGEAGKGSSLVAESPSSLSDTSFTSLQDMSPDRLSSVTLTTTSELARLNGDPVTALSFHPHAHSVTERLDRVASSNGTFVTQGHRKTCGIFGSPLQARKGSQPIITSSQHGISLFSRHTSLPGTPVLLSPHDRRRSNTPTNKACFVPLPNVDEKLLQNSPKHSSGNGTQVITAIIHSNGVHHARTEKKLKKKDGCQRNSFENESMSVSQEGEKIKRNNSDTLKKAEDSTFSTYQVQSCSDSEIQKRLEISDKRQSKNLDENYEYTPSIQNMNEANIVITKQSPNNGKTVIGPSVSPTNEGTKGHLLQNNADRVSPDLGVDTSPTGTLDGEDNRSMGFGSSSTMSVGSDVSPSVDRRKLYPLLDRTQRSNSLSTGEEFLSSDYDEGDDLDKTLERDSGRGSLSEKVTGDKVRVKEKIHVFRLHSTSRQNSNGSTDQSEPADSRPDDEDRPVMSPHHMSKQKSPKHRKLSKSRPRTVEELLNRLGLQHLLLTFGKSRFETLDLFSQLDECDLNDLGITSGEDRAKVLTAAELLLDFDGLDIDESQRSTPTSHSSESSTHSPVTVTAESGCHDNRNSSPQHRHSIPQHTRHSHVTHSKRQSALGVGDTPCSPGKHKVKENGQTQIVSGTNTQFNNEPVTERIKNCGNTDSCTIVVKPMQGEGQTTTSKSAFSTFKPPEEEEEDLETGVCLPNGLSEETMFTTEDKEVISITNRKEHGRRSVELVSSSQGKFPSFIAASNGSPKTRKGPAGNQSKNVYKDGTGTLPTKFKYQRTKLVGSQGPVSKSSAASTHPISVGCKTVHSKTAPAPPARVSSQRGPTKSTESSLVQASGTPVNVRYKAHAKPRPSIPQRTVSLSSADASRVSLVTLDKLNTVNIPRTCSSVCNQNQTTSSVATREGSIYMSTFQSPETPRKATGKSSSEKRRHSVSQSLETLLSQKVAEENIDLTAPPYTTEHGSCGVPVALVLRYTDEMQRDPCQVAAAVEICRIKRLQHEKKPVMSCDSFVEACNTGSAEYIATSVEEFLVSCGLPMYVDLLAESSLSTIEKLRNCATDPELQHCGIRDQHHRKWLLGAVETLRSSPPDSNKCVAIHRKASRSKHKSAIIDKV